MNQRDVGKWKRLFSCRSTIRSNTKISSCLRAFCLLSLLVSLTPVCFGTTRQYYVAAEDADWDYAPSGRDLLHDMRLPMPWNAKTKFRKTRYVEYSDATFSKRKPQPAWLGILGPIIRAEVGDTVVVEFLNRSALPHSMHPHGLHYDKESEGSLYAGAGPGARVPATGRFTYRWTADKKSGPGPNDASSKVWMYHSHVEEELEMNEGLMGPIIVCGKGKCRPDGSAKDVDRELVVSFQIFDQGIYPPESHSHVARDQDLFHTINGFVFGNLPELALREGEKVRWYLLAMGSEKDLHTPHWHGETVTNYGRNTDVIELLPASMVTVDMIADNPGTWLFHCQVADHMEAGMMATYTIQAKPRSCPVRFSSGKFWGGAKSDFQIQLTNTSEKTISRLDLGAETFVGPSDVRPFYGEWGWSQPLQSNHSVTLRKDDELHNSSGIQGWVFYPNHILFSDGTVWGPRQRGECFTVFWRDEQHPDVTVLPPLQLDAGDPD